MTINEQLLTSLTQGKHKLFLEKLHESEPENLQVIELLSEFNSLENSFNSHVINFEDYQIVKAKLRNRIFKLLQDANIHFATAHKDPFLFQNEIITLYKHNDIFVFDWKYTDKNSRFMVETFAICLGVLSENARVLGLDSVKIIVDNSKLSIKALKKVYSFDFFEKSREIIALSQIKPEIVITVIDVLVVESAIRVMYKHADISEFLFVKTLQEALKIIENE
jgi:hypothetical protein